MCLVGMERRILCSTLVALMMHSEKHCIVKLVMWVEVLSFISTALLVICAVANCNRILANFDEVKFLVLLLFFLAVCLTCCFCWYFKLIIIVLLQRKLLAIYLHHDQSIFANVFCSQVLCAESLASFLSANFITWAWDLTHAFNREKYVFLWINALQCKDSYSATSNNMKLVHWPLMGGLLHLVQQGGDWVGPQPTQSPPHSTKCNSSPINGQYTNHRIAV